MKIALTSIPVSDPVKAFAFYTEVLGFVEHTFMPDHQLAIVVSPEDKEGTALMLEPMNDLVENFQKSIYKLGLPYIIFGVENCEKAYKELVAKGVKFTQEPKTTDYGTQAMLEDGFGNIVQIHQEN